MLYKIKFSISFFLLFFFTCLLLNAQNNVDCANVASISLNGNCSNGNNQFASFNGELPNCSSQAVGSMWYRYNCTFSTGIRITTSADFNDVLTVYSGSCSALTTLICSNRDEFGFKGETIELNAVVGTNYYIRISGTSDFSSAATGNFCLQVSSINTPAIPPVNDDCTNAQLLQLNQSCISGSNCIATFNGPIPSTAPYAKADIWYRFQATNQSPVYLQSNANFAEAITLYSGSCGNLTEVASSNYGQELEVSGLTNGTMYYAQVSGLLPSIEGSVCMRISDSPRSNRCDMPSNLSATIISGHTVKLDWTSVAEANKFKVRYKVLNAPNWIEVNAIVSERFLNALNPNTTYQYSIKSVCENESSVWAITRNFTTGNDLCDFPYTSSVNANSPTTATISWESLAQNIKYKLKYKRKANGEQWNEVQPGTSSKSLTNLVASSNYKYKLKTKCPNGWTNWTPKYEFSMPSSMTEPLQAFVNGHHPETLNINMLDDDDEIPLRRNEYSEQTVNTSSNLVIDYFSITFLTPSTVPSTFQVYNELGQLVKQEIVPENIQQFTTDFSMIENGIYFYILNDEEGVLKTGRIVKMNR